MKYKILYLTDFHKRMKDISTIKGYVNVQNMIQEDIIQTIIEGGYNMVFLGGDWYDGGYGTDISSALAHTEFERKLYELMNGNLYGVIGNHIRVRMDSNPELFLIQPHPHFKTRIEVDRDYQIIKTPDNLILNDVQFSFVHHNRYADGARDYKVVRDDGVKYHVGLFHTESVIPASVLYNAGFTAMVSDDSQIADCLYDIDFAVVGHIHKPIGTFPIRLPNNRVCHMCVPGSLMNTDAGMNSRHDHVDFPSFEVDEDGKVTISYVRFDLHLDKIHFAPKVDNSAEKLKTTRGNVQKELYSNGEVSKVTSLVGNDPKLFASLNMFMANQGYNANDKKLINSILDNPGDIKNLMEVWKEREEEDLLME